MSPVPPARWRRALALVVTAWAVLLVLPAAPAHAHAELLSTDPAEASVVAEAPEEIVFTYSEPVRLTAQEFRLYDDAGELVETEARASGDEVRVRVADPASMADGTYVVGWYVVSADGHPISGSLSFSVGERSAEDLSAPAAPESSMVVVGTSGVLQGLGYVGLLVAAGLACFVALVLPDGFAGDRARARIRLVVRVAAATAATAFVLLVPVSAVYAQGAELVDAVSAFDLSLVRTELVAAGVVVLGLAACAALVGTTPPHGRRRWLLVGAAALAALGPSLVGHTRAFGPEALLVAADWVHVAAGATWLGGLVGLVVALRALATREVLAARVLARFSTLAAGVLVALAVTGSLLAWRVLGEWEALVETDYGRLLLVKLGVAACVVAVAGVNRWRLLPRVHAAAGHGDRVAAAGAVRRAVRLEAALLVALLGLTGFLVNASPRPAPVDVPPGRTGVEAGTAGEVEVLALLTPQEQGPNTLLVQLQDETGEPVELERPPEVELSSPDIDLGSVPLTSVDAGTWRAAVLLPVAGGWEVRVSVPEDRFTNPVTTVRFIVR